MSGHRRLRVGALLRNRLAEIFERRTLFESSGSGASITVLRVEMSADLKIADVYVTALGGDDAALIASLHGHRRFLRGEIGRVLPLRFTPELRFRSDPGFAHSLEIDALLRSPSVRRDLTPPDSQPSDLPASDLSDSGTPGVADSSPIGSSRAKTSSS